MFLEVFHRILAIAASILLVALSFGVYRAWESDRAEVVTLVQSTGLRTRLPEMATTIEGEPDAVRSKIKLAQVLLAEGYDQRWLNRLTPEEARREIVRIDERLKLARAMAAEVLKRRPANWEAAMVLGGATFLEQIRAGDAKLIAEKGNWEAPLLYAVSMAPGKAAPSRLLASAYLSVWPALSYEEQGAARNLLDRAFENTETFQLLAEDWLRIAGDRQDAFSLVPDDPVAWQELLGIYSRRFEWESFAAAYHQWDDALLSDLGRRLEDALERLRGGDLRVARLQLLSIATEARYERRYGDIITRAIEQCPPGHAPDRYSNKLKKLLDQVLGDCALGQCLVSEIAVRRLVPLSGASEPEQQALAALVSRDLPAAEVYERRSEALLTEVWAPYVFLKARILAENGDVDESHSTLAKLHHSWRDRLVVQEARHAIARDSGSSVESANEQRRLGELARSVWPGIDWRWRENVAQLELLPSKEAESLEITLDVVPPAGAVIEIRWDHQSVSFRDVRQGQSVRLDLALTQKSHLLELVSLVGGRVVPGRVELTPSR